MIVSDIKELVIKAANGDRAAFDSLYEQTKNGVWFTCISILNNEENAKDIMQDTYLTAFERLGTLSDPAAVQSWLNRIAANKCKNHITAKSNSAVENDEDIIDNIPDDGLIPEEYAEDKAKRELIMKLIRDALSEEQYMTVILYYFDEMTAAEIAALMDCHEKTVRYRLKVARVKIKEAIAQYEEENREKLHAVVPMLPLSRLLRAESENASVPSIAPAAPQVPVNTPPQNAPNVPQEPAAYAVNTGGKTMLNSLKSKIIAGACAAAVVGGGVTAGVLISNNSKNKTESNPTYSVGTNYSNPTNTSKPAANSNSGSGTTSKPATSTPVSTDKVDYPKFEGLEAYKFISRIKGENQPDTVSGNIKEMRNGNRAFILLTNDNEIVMFRADAYEVKVSYGIDPNITTLENTYYDEHNSDGFLAINGNYIMYKAVGNDGEIRLSKEGNPRSFSGYMDFGDRITKVVMADLWHFYALDAEGLSVKLSHRFWDHSESPIYRDCVSVIDGDYVYYSGDDEWGFYVGGVKVKEFAGDYCLTDEGKMFNHDDRKPLDFLDEYTFKDIYYDNYTRGSVITGVTEDDKLVTFDASGQKVLFTGESPDGNLQDIWQNSGRVIVKTDKGVFVHEFENDTGFRPVETLNNTGEEVLYIVGKYVLLGNGFVYEIKNFL